jgi:ABC-type nitrate/sulfonate/bicarbonate transport system substrate-binding protein
MPTRRNALAASAAFVLAPRLVSAQTAPDVVRVAKAINTSFPFSAIDVGLAAGIWKAQNLELQVSAFNGDAQVQQAFAAGAIDVGLGSGPAMAYRAKGVPAIAVAVMAGKPLDQAIVVAKGSDIKTLADLKGKRIGVTTAGSLTDWIARQIAYSQGWGADGVEIVPLGSQDSRLAALSSGQIAASVNDTTMAYQIELLGKGTILGLFGDVVKNFDTHVIFAADPFVANHAPVVQRFLKGWFTTVAYMRAHRDATIAIVAKTMGVDNAAVARSYAANMLMMSSDGVFTTAALDEVRRSVRELGLYDGTLDPATMYTSRFVPVTI